MALALFFNDKFPGLDAIFMGLFSACLSASANYCINEYLDAPFDRLHPTKANRPAARGLVTKHGVILEYVILLSAAALMGFMINSLFGWTIIFFNIMGLCYNVEPLRTKDIPYLDVISESINNPIRLVLGWAIFIPQAFPPSSFVLAYWAAGAFLMTLKRYAEIKTLKDPALIASYRKSLAGYDAGKLLSTAVFYAMNTALFLGISLIKYKIDFILLFPAIALLFSWYFAISLSANSVVQTPEKLYKEKRFMLYVTLVCILFCVLCFVSIPWLDELVIPLKFNKL